MKKYLLFYLAILLSIAGYGQPGLVTATTTVKQGTIPPASQTIYIDNAVEGAGNNQNTYVGTGWSIQSAKADSYAQTFIYNKVNNDYVETDFVGFQAALIAEKYPTHGIVAVSIDNGSETMVDLYSATVVEWKTNPAGATVYTSPTLTNGPHTIKVRITNTKNASSSDFYGVIDAFVITQNGSTPPPVTPSGNWFVNAAVSSSGAGTTVGTAFKTIQEAATVAQPGDKVTILSGTYRETITPVNSGTSVSPIIYEAASGATVIVSGTNTISNGAWTNHSGNIYKATIDFGEPLFDEYMTGFNNENFNYNNTEILAQQVFQNGNMQFLAQYPDVSTPEDLLERETSRGRNLATSFTQTAINDSPLDDYGDLTGAYVWVNGWFLSYTRTITSHSGTTINFSSTDGNIAFSKFYRVFGKLNLLTAAKEWFWDDPTNTLYLWQTGGGSPTSVEYKQRNWGFDIRAKTYITIRGLQFFACEPVMTNALSTNATIDNIQVKYQNHSVLETKGGADGYHDSAVQTGMKVMGANSVVKNSEFRYGAGMGIWAGSNTTIQNNYFYNYSYAGQYSGFVKPIWGSSNIKINNNTFTRCGRGAIEFTPESSSINNLNVEMGYNDYSFFNMLNVDGGAIYASRIVDMSGSRVHHSHFHNDGGYDEAGTGKQDGIQVNGPYLDQATGPLQIDHCLFWNGIVNGADIYTDLTYSGGEGSRTVNPTSLIYNNTLASVNSSSGGVSSSYADYDLSPSDVQRNNIYRMGRYIGPAGTSPGNIANSLANSNNPLFAGGSLPTDNYTPVSNPQTYFQLGSGSPARNIGVLIPGINDDDTGGYDAGAYPFGQTAWTNPGYVAVTYVPTP